MILLLKNLLFTLVVPGTVAVYVPLLMMRGHAPATGAVLVLAVGALACGAGLYSWCVWNFAVHGRGTPAPIDAPKQVVVRGPYRFTRNPMYLGVLSVILGWSILFQSPALLFYMLVVGTGFNLMIVLYEEPHLRKVFGNDYEAYCARVGRWLPGRVK